MQSEDGKKTNVSSAELIERDIYASNGVIHTISSLLVPPDALRITPEKYLLALNCSSFVDLIHSVGLTSLINDTETHWTILAPQDDVISMFDNGELPPRGSGELKKMLQYHFIPGKKTPKKLFKGMLLETALKESGLGGGRQVLSVDVHGDGPKDTKKDKSVGFGGASTIGDPGMLQRTYHVCTLLTDHCVDSRDQQYPNILHITSARPSCRCIDDCPPTARSIVFPRRSLLHQLSGEAQIHTPNYVIDTS